MSDKPMTCQGDLAHLPPALEPLTQQDRWIAWRWEWQASKRGAGKWTQAALQPRDPKRYARSKDPATWASHADAVAAVLTGQADGIGYMLSGSDIGVCDLNSCRHPQTGAIKPWAEALRAEANGAYCEVTVSGAGLRFIGKANGPRTHRKFAINRNTGASLELCRKTARYVAISRLQVGDCSELRPLDDFIDTLLARYIGQAQRRDGFDFNGAGQQQSSTDYDDLIRNGAPQGRESELFQAVVWQLAAKGWSADQITDELGCHPNGVGANYADCLASEVTRCYQEWRSRGDAAGAGGWAPVHDPWPQIYVRAGELPRVVNEAEDALLLLGREIYQRGGLIVRPVLSSLRAADDRDIEGWRLIEVTRPYLVEMLTRAARFLKYDARARGFVPTDAPDKVAETYLARQGAWRLPVLSGIVNTPFLRADGSPCEQPGYDAASGLLFMPDGESFPPIPQQPSRTDALAALAVIERLIETFPFVTPADRAVAMAAILTALDRRAMATAPLHAFTAPTGGTGKSLLVDTMGMLATGRRMPMISQGSSEEELEKRLGAALIAGDLAISIDNCEHPLQSAFLCQALTQRQLNIRLLGLTQNVETPVNAAIFATGNNLIIEGDLTRRTLLCSLDARCERPELRTFNVDVLEAARADRGRLVVAALTALRAWQLARASEQLSLPPFGSFEDWSRRIREPLVWLGRADPCETVAKVRDNDPGREALRAVVMQWKENLGLGQAYTVQQVIARAATTADFHGALLNVAANRAGLIGNDRLGRWLRKVQGKIAVGLILLQDGSRHGYPLWKLVKG